VLIGSLTGGKHDRDFCRCLFGGKARRRARGHDDVDLALHELRRKPGKAVELGIRINVFGFDGAALDVTEVAHPTAIFFQQRVLVRACTRYQPPDPRALSRALLGKSLERGRDRGCAQRNEERAACDHGITPSLWGASR
jgi:hypothetical protein